MAVATKDVPRLNVLVSQCLKCKAGVGEVIRTIERSVEQTYHARSYTDMDLDMALLTLRLGGRALLYAFNQYISLPTIRTLQRARVFTKLLPCLGRPRKEEVLWNMAQVFDPRKHLLNSNAQRKFCSGWVFVWDEVALEPLITYWPHADSAGGGAHEDADKVSMRLSTFDNALTIARALADGTIEYGKEASVIALASFSPLFRDALPVFISPTSKKETPTESAEILQMMLEAWCEYGADSFGPIWSFASDGDAGRRSMVYKMFVRTSLTPSHALWKYLGRLPGLNLEVGEYDITGDFDWKHELKRM